MDWIWSNGHEVEIFHKKPYDVLLFLLFYGYFNLWKDKIKLFIIKIRPNSAKGPQSIY